MCRVSQLSRIQRGVMLCVSTFSIAAILGTSVCTQASAGSPGTNDGDGLIASGRKVLYDMKLPDKRRAIVYADGRATIYSKDGAQSQDTFLPRGSTLFGDVSRAVRAPGKSDVMLALMKNKAPNQEHPLNPFEDHEVIVVFKSGVSPAQDSFTVPSTALRALHRQSLKARTSQLNVATLPAYTNSLQANAVLAHIGVSRAERLFSRFSRSMLASMRSGIAATGRNVLDFSSAYKLHITGSPVLQAVRELEKSPAIAYASPNWHVTDMHTNPVELAQSTASFEISRTRSASSRFGASAGAGSENLPTNYGLSSSAQSLLNAPSVNAAVAFDEIDKQFHQLPGQGEIITNVSLGDLTDANNSGDPTGACVPYTQSFGPTTNVINGQRYIDWPSMPLIATYSADTNGQLSGSAAVCGQDSSLGEVGLDFSMMAPLPHANQRAGETGSAYTDLLGIAPGATYRLVVPRNFGGQSDIIAAFLGAAMQSPRPQVITASLGFGFDVNGFPGRYLEDDPLTAAVIQSIVQNFNIVVCISGNDGTREFTNAAIGPSGGSAATTQIPSGGTPTTLNDIADTTVPSADFDTGAIDVGGTTLDDIFAAPPQDPSSHGLASQHAFAETRWTGFAAFSSAFGSRVNVSAPSDNVLSLFHQLDPSKGFDNVGVAIEGGTSASAPEVAAAAAVAMQVARLTGHQFQRATDVRQFLADTGTVVPKVPQADVYNNVGPQINVGNIVDTLLQKGGRHVLPGVARVAIEQRRNDSPLDSFFITDTDPGNIDLLGPVSSADNTLTGRNQKAWITIAPDWEGLPQNVDFRLNVVGNDSTSLGLTRWTRLLPEQILRAAGLQLVSSTARTVQLRYRAFIGHHTLAQVTFALTFGPAQPTTREVLAPVAPAVAIGMNIPVTYDLRNVRDVQNPVLLITEPGRFDITFPFLPQNVSYTVPLTALSGTIKVPISALQGGGIYGIGVRYGSICCDPHYGIPVTLYSDFAFTRVGPNSTTRPAAPMFSIPGQTGMQHSIQFPDGTPLKVTWDVSKISGANGAALELSAPGPGIRFQNLNLFNNPNGTTRDANGLDTGSVSFIPLSGVSGVASFDPKTLGIVPGMAQSARIVPMRGASIVGEAGDVSTIHMQGVVPPDGGGFSGNGGYGISRASSSGFFATVGFEVDGGIFSSLYTFDQNTNKVTSVIAHMVSPQGSASLDFFDTIGTSVYANDIAVYRHTNEQNTGAFSQDYSTFNAATGAILGAWTPPVPAGTRVGIRNASVNSIGDNVAFQGSLVSVATSSQISTDVFESNLAQNTFSQYYDVTPGKVDARCRNGDIIGFDLNSITNVAVGGEYFCGDLMTLNFNTGALDELQTSPPTGFSFQEGLAVDPATNKAGAVRFKPSIHSDIFTIYDLATKSSVQIPVVPIGKFTANDDINHLFLIALDFQQNVRTDNNALSAIQVYNENGTLLKTLKTFDINFQLRPIGLHNIQINPSRRTGYIVSPFGELEPFAY